MSSQCTVNLHRVAINWTSMVPDRLLALNHNFASLSHCTKLSNFAISWAPKDYALASERRSHGSTGALPLDPTGRLPSHPLIFRIPLVNFLNPPLGAGCEMSDAKSYTTQSIECINCTRRCRTRQSTTFTYTMQASLVVSATTETPLIDINVHSVHGEGLQSICIP